MDCRQIPYGIGDFERIRLENYFYLDKTRFIPALERAANFNFLLRPRRFGKSLFCGMLQCYYDLAHKDRFDELFQGTWIHSHPTAERGKYLILSLNFSAVDPEVRNVEESFYEHVRLKIEAMVKTRYAALFPVEAARSILAHGNVTSLTAALFEFCRDHNLPLYLIIDEYDNFANSILAAAGEDAYRALTHGAGFFKHFFALFKAGATGPGAAV